MDSELATEHGLRVKYSESRHRRVSSNVLVIAMPLVNLLGSQFGDHYVKRCK